ncbi:hypothetical protein BVC80_1835g572 [Macleaya cordata]|uniref:Poly(ADP-ribose) polymerase n=1 Tax=Macleaya cordata TaxID=56857 RepID=A0A200R632_MACCD|nr:hypothetical protein BVC80_1835g572 [Macleaya cordata]
MLLPCKSLKQVHGTMAEKCLTAASLAVLIFHPSSSFKCFKPKSSTISPERERPSPSSKTPNLSPKKISSKSKNKQDIKLSNGSDSECSSPPSRRKIRSQSVSELADREPEMGISQRNLFSKSRNKQEITPSNGSYSEESSHQSRQNTLSESISELANREPATGIVQAIFKSSWTNKKVPTIEKVLRVHHTAEVLNRFEEYRELVKSRAAEICISKRKERWVADGNEVLRYHGAVLKCPLGYDRYTSICGHQSCEVCSIIGSGFSVRANWISLCESSWRAHEKMTERDCGKLAMRAMLICRVIAGRVAYDHGKGLVEGEEGGFDSMAGPSSVQPYDEQELVVLDPRAVLPCFVIIYNSQ